MRRLIYFLTLLYYLTPALAAPGHGFSPLRKDSSRTEATHVINIKKRKPLLNPNRLVKAAQLPASTDLLDSLIRANSYTFKIENGNLTGTGVDFILNKTKNVQFVSLGEEHNAQDIPRFTAALFRLLQENRGYQYLALEQDGLSMRTLSDSKLHNRGNADSAFSLLKRFPYSYTFASDQEVNMIAEVGRISKALYPPVWGCDPAFGASHYLAELIKLAPDETARKYTKKLMDTIWKIEYSRDSPFHYMSQRSKVEYFEELTRLYRPTPGSAVEKLIDALKTSATIYGAMNKTPYPVQTGYYNIVLREAHLRARFMEEYKNALKVDKKLPRVLLKFGQWHITNGFGPGGELTLGNFVKNLARSNNMDAFNVDMEIYGKPGTRYGKYVTGHDILKIFAAKCDINQWTIIDLVPLRYYIAKITSTNSYIPDEVQERFWRYTLNYDALLLFGSGEPGTYDWKKK